MDLGVYCRATLRARPTACGMVSGYTKSAVRAKAWVRAEAWVRAKAWVRGAAWVRSRALVVGRRV